MTNAELYHLTLNAYHEARGEPDEGIRAVVKVVLNRAKRRKQSIIDVIYAPYQFEWTASPKKRQSNPLLNDTSGYKRCRIQVKKAIAEYNSGDTMRWADHYHADWMNPFPSWAESLVFVDHIGQHIFYRG